MQIRSAVELGHLVKASRRDKSLTQAELAALVGVSRKWVVELESGKRTIDLTLVLRTLNALGLVLNVHAREVRLGNLKIDIDSIVESSRK